MRGGSEVVSDGKRYVDEIPHEGYFTQDELRGLVAYAQERHIDIVPEFDVPGHCIALIAAYPELSCSGKVTEVRKKWGISKDILCAGNDKVYEVVRDILDEICDVFPSEYIHLGGDEAPKERWCNCKLCKQRLSELKLGSFEKLQTYMVECFREHLAEKGRKVICWNDGLGDDANGEIVSQVWWVHGCAKRAATKQINNGRKAIMSATPYVYFDYPYSVTPLKKTLSYNPLGGVRASARENVLGVEGALWTEYVADTDKLFFNLLPRLDVLAECAWGYHTNKFSAICVKSLLCTVRWDLRSMATSTTTDRLNVGQPRASSGTKTATWKLTRTKRHTPTKTEPNKFNYNAKKRCFTQVKGFT